MAFSAAAIQTKKRTKKREARELERSGIRALSKTLRDSQTRTQSNHFFFTPNKFLYYMSIITYFLSITYFYFTTFFQLFSFFLLPIKLSMFINYSFFSHLFIIYSSFFYSPLNFLCSPIIQFFYFFFSIIYLFSTPL